MIDKGKNFWTVERIVEWHKKNERIEQLETDNAKLLQAVNDKDQELFESQALVAQLEEELDNERSLRYETQNKTSKLIYELEEENAELKRVTKLFHGYEVPELFKVIADDYRNPRAADIVRDARCMWLIDFADALIAGVEQEDENPYGLIDWRKPVEGAEHAPYICTVCYTCIYFRYLWVCLGPIVSKSIRRMQSPHSRERRRGLSDTLKP